MTDHAVLEAHISDVRSDLREVKESMRQIAEAMTRLAILEERHQSVTARLNRFEERQQDIEKKMAEVREAHVILTATLDGVSKSAKFMWLVMGAGVIGLGFKALGSVMGL